jgi:exo-beta-1,3-glucanase (GH17 family)
VSVPVAVAPPQQPSTPQTAPYSSTAEQSTECVTGQCSNSGTTGQITECVNGHCSNSETTSGQTSQCASGQCPPSGTEVVPVGHGPDHGVPSHGPKKGPSPPTTLQPGISYTAYRADHGCKSASDIKDDFEDINGLYSVVRIYGTDCDQVPHVYAAAKPQGIKLFLGIWDINDVDNEADKIISAINGDWDMVHTVSVGNELVNNGQASTGQVVGAVNQARTLLRAAGYPGPVVAVDTFIATEANPDLCNESDYCAVNAHAFFDSTISADEAGKWLQSTVQRIKSVIASPHQRIVITETGWPTNGVSNGLAVPGISEQKAALDSIKEAFADNPGDIVLFSAFNDMWKTESMATFNADQWWGINGATSRCDSAH